MKPEELAMLAAILGGLFFIGKKFTETGKGKVAESTSNGWASEIFTSGDQKGWRYFTDGTAISPTGVYFKNGVQVYSAG